MIGVELMLGTNDVELNIDQDGRDIGKNVFRIK